MCSVFSPVKEMTPADYRRVTEVTYLGFVHGTLAALKRMLPRDRGIIVQVGSALAYRGIPLQSAYCAAKHAIQGFTESVRCELIHDHSNVKITMVQMPALNTPQFDWVKSRMPRKAAAGAADLPAGGRRRRHRLRRPPLPPRVVRRRLDGRSPSPATRSPRASATGTWPSRATTPSSTTARTTPTGRNNLYEPVDEDRDFGAHGDFDDRAHAHSFQLWADQHRDWIALAGLAARPGRVPSRPGKFWRGGLSAWRLGAWASWLRGRVPARAGP